MNQDVIKIRCPHCGAQLSVKNQPGIEGKSVTCPICKQKSPFTAFRKISMAPQSDPGTDLPGQGANGGGGDTTQYDGRNSGAAAQRGAAAVGKLVVKSTGQSFILKPGRNIIGRRAQASSANFQIETGEGRRMSREHLVIDVRVVGNQTLFIASLYKEHVNATSVDQETMAYGDEVILKPGCVIHLPDADLVFSLFDTEGTEY